MTKQYLVAFASAIRTKFQLDRPWASVPVAVQVSALDSVDVVAQIARQFNPRFDERQFRLACGVWTN